MQARDDLARGGDGGAHVVGVGVQGVGHATSLQALAVVRFVVLLVSAGPVVARALPSGRARAGSRDRRRARQTAVAAAWAIARPAV